MNLGKLIFIFVIIIIFQLVDYHKSLIIVPSKGLKKHTDYFNVSCAQLETLYFNVNGRQSKSFHQSSGITQRDEERAERYPSARGAEFFAARGRESVEEEAARKRQPIIVMMDASSNELQKLNCRCRVTEVSGDVTATCVSRESWD